MGKDEATMTPFQRRPVKPVYRSPEEKNPVDSEKCMNISQMITSQQYQYLYILDIA